jgi:hypothetical protein
MKMLDERTMVSDSYAPFGELPQLPDRPEPARTGPVYLTRGDIESRFGWAPSQFDEAQGRGFPQPYRTLRPYWTWQGKKFKEILTWLERDVERWAQGLAGLGK